MKSCVEYKLLDKRLHEYCGHGLRSKFFREVLVPDWWDDSLKSDTGLVKSLVLHIGRMLGVKPKCFEQESGPFEFLFPANAAYKMRSIDTSVTLASTTAYLQNIAACFVSGLSNSSTAFQRAEEIREKILCRAKTVDLYSLLDYCWEIGVPVINLSLPTGTKWHKPQAVTFRVQDRYCIFLLENNRFQARYLFPLAHELGHILCGHFKNDAYLYDNEYRDEADAKEKEASSFAAELLGGNCLDDFHSTNPSEIARWATNKSNDRQIDAGYLVLSYGFKNKMMPSANAALKIINQDDGNGPVALIKSKIYKYLEEDNYSFEKLDVLVKAINLEI